VDRKGWRETGSSWSLGLVGVNWFWGGGGCGGGNLTAKKGFDVLRDDECTMGSRVQGGQGEYRKGIIDE
jgi:hypothetical protein